jgi:hypothetical protein
MWCEEAVSAGHVHVEDSSSGPEGARQRIPAHCAAPNGLSDDALIRGSRLSRFARSFPWAPHHSHSRLPREATYFGHSEPAAVVRPAAPDGRRRIWVMVGTSSTNW